jgi:hypothetical protein
MENVLQIFFAGGLIAVVLYIMKIVHKLHKEKERQRIQNYELQSKEIDSNNSNITNDQRLERFNKSTDDLINKKNP